MPGSQCARNVVASVPRNKLTSYGPAFSTKYEASYVPSPQSTSFPRLVSPPTRAATPIAAPPWKSRLPRASRASIRITARSPATAPARPCPESRHIGRLTSCASTSTTSGDPTTGSPFTAATISWRPTSHQRTDARYRLPRSAKPAASACDAPEGVSRCTLTASWPDMPRPVLSYSSACKYTSRTAPQVARSPTPGPGRSTTSLACSGPYVASTSAVLSLATRPLTTACTIQRPACGQTNAHPYEPSPWSTTSTALARAPVGP